MDGITMAVVIFSALFALFFAAMLNESNSV